MEFITVYVKPFMMSRIDIETLEELFGVEISMGDSNYINVYTIDRSVVDSVVAELGEHNIEEVVYP